MSQQDDRTQQMIDEGLIFGPDENEPPRADDPLVDKHVHVYHDEETNREEVYSLDE